MEKEQLIKASWHKNPKTLSEIETEISDTYPLFITSNQGTKTLKPYHRLKHGEGSNGKDTLRGHKNPKTLSEIETQIFAIFTPLILAYQAQKP